MNDQDNSHPVIRRAKEIESEMMLGGFSDSPMTRLKSLYRSMSEVMGRVVIPSANQESTEALYKEVGITFDDVSGYLDKKRMKGPLFPIESTLA